MVITLDQGWLKKSVVVEFYDSDNELPAKNYNAYQQLVMLDLGIGSDMDAFNNHIAKLVSYISHDKKAQAMNEVKNMFKGYYQQIENYSTASYQILPFVKTINGKRYEIGDLDKCKTDLDMLSDAGLTIGHLSELLSDLRKKSLARLLQPFTKAVRTQEFLTQARNFNDSVLSL